MEKRRTDFSWSTKQELYDYFSQNYGYSTVRIDREIERAMHDFKLRQGQAIDTKELWQKVGNSLRRKAVRVKKTGGNG